MGVACDGYLTSHKQLGKYPLPNTNTKVNGCFSIYQNSEIIKHKNMIFYSFIPSMITIFWAQIPYQLLEGELQRIFRVYVANQSAPSKPATVLVYTNTS